MTNSETTTQPYTGIDDLTLSLSDGVLSMTLNRPDSLNSLTALMLETIAAALERAATAAFQWFEGLMKASRSLERSPFRCAVARESVFFDEEIRHLDYRKYRILFTVKGKTVIVLRVRHGSRDYLRSEDEIG